MKTFFATIKAFFRDVGQALNGPTARPSSNCGNINALLIHLCDYDTELHTWVLRWLAYPLRNPGAKMATCLLVNGDQGTGKSLFFDDVMSGVYGATCRTVAPHRLEPNALPLWTRDARFVVVDGRYSNETMGHLKHLVTDSAIYTVAASKRSAELQPNHMNFVFCTGEVDFLPVEVANRRFVVIEAPPPQHRRFYEAAHYEIDNGGVEVFREYLLTHLDMGDFNATTPAPAAAGNLVQVRKGLRDALTAARKAHQASLKSTKE